MDVRWHRVLTEKGEVASIIFSIQFGSVNIPFQEILTTFYFHLINLSIIFIQNRLPENPNFFEFIDSLGSPLNGCSLYNISDSLSTYSNL